MVDSPLHAANNPQDQDDADDEPHVAVRRHHDRCFHVAQEVVPEGYIVQGVLIPLEEVAQVVRLDEGQAPPACPR